ncbi:MAG: phenylacetate--CoA ligase family protein [Selenomonadaceae bacterium]|nr:phenylacetate--CoA ligase family protein [Selenomonadaceae bacterium]
MYANEQIETMNREDLKSLQLERLKKTVEWAYEKSAYYNQVFRRRKIKPDNIKTLKDIQNLPFVNIASLHRTDPLDILTLPLSGVLRFSHNIESSGEITKLYTKGDVQQNVEMMIRCLIAADITRASTVGLQGDLSDSKFLDILYALESIGATVVPLGTDYRQWLRLIELVNMDTLISTPQLIMQLVIQLQATGKNIVDYPISKILCINTSNIQNPLQQHIQDRTRSTVYNLYAPPELGFAGMIYQCNERSGLHVQEDYYLVELLHFDSEEVLDENDRMGELVITTLAAQAMPLIRYRTGQAVRRLSEPCSCGRTCIRIATPYTKV